MDFPPPPIDEESALGRWLNRLAELVRINRITDSPHVRAERGKRGTILFVKKGGGGGGGDPVWLP